VVSDKADRPGPHPTWTIPPTADHPVADGTSPAPAASRLSRRPGKASAAAGSGRLSPHLYQSIDGLRRARASPSSAATTAMAYLPRAAFASWCTPAWTARAARPSA
jgi:hypothetical protein